MDDKKFQSSNWLTVRMLDKRQRVRYALYAAEGVLGIYEHRSPRDRRPRKAIEAVKAWLNGPSENITSPTNLCAQASAAAAYAAGDAAIDASYAAANAAAAAAYAAAEASYNPISSAGPYDAAYASAAVYSASAANAVMREKCLNYGFSLLNENAAGRITESISIAFMGALPVYG